MCRIILLMVICFPEVVFSQNGRVVKSRITDRQSVQVLAGATVAIKSKTLAVTPDHEGHFGITIGDHV